MYEDDDEIFEIRRIKPVANLTKEKAFEIRKNVIQNEEIINIQDNSCDSEETGNDCHQLCVTAEIKSSEICNVISHDGDVVVDITHNQEYRDLDEIIITKTKETHTDISTPKKKIIKFSPSKLITDYYSPSKGTDDVKVISPYKSENHAPPNSFYTEELSPSIRKRNKKFKLGNGNMVSPKKVHSSTDFSPKKVMNKETECMKRNLSSMRVFKSKGNSWNTVSPKKDDFGVNESSYRYSVSLKKIIHEELKNQLNLEERAIQEKQLFSKLFLKEDYECFENFFRLPDNACKLFARMLCRKKKWHRVSGIFYSDISNKLEEIFDVLHKNNFVDFDIVNEGMEVQFQLLTKGEILSLCKNFSIKLVNAGAKKQDLIDAILKSTKNQRSVIDSFMKNQNSSRLKLLQTEIVRALGKCVKLNNSALSSFNRLLLLFSLTQDSIEDDKWSSQIRLMIDIINNTVRFPSYKVSPTVIFEIIDDFMSYEKAIKLLFDVETAISNKNHIHFFSLAQKAKRKFKAALENEGFKERFLKLPSYLKKYNAGSVYARVLSLYCMQSKRQKSPEEVVEIMTSLINQNIFLVNKKFEWYSVLVQAYEDMGELVKAASTLSCALKEEKMNEIDRLTLQERAQKILKKKKINGIIGDELRNELNIYGTIRIAEPAKVEISARIVAGNEPGFKSIYINDVESCRTYCSVEETAISYYKENGFSEGIHSEGFIIHTIYFLIFFDIIYGTSPPGVFQSRYQTKPLDFGSEVFYLNRKDIIDMRFDEMQNWTLQEFKKIITKVYTENYGINCLVTWKEHFDPELLCDIVKCLGMKQLIHICKRLSLNFRIYRSGFPDLTLWNPSTGKCKFVEVKSQNDKLSCKQKVWLDFLHKHDIDCEICVVKSTSALYYEKPKLFLNEKI